MALDAVANFVRGTTDAAVDNTATTLSVTDATIFPDPGTQGEYNVVIWDADSFPRPDQDPSVEVLRVTARDTGTDELTVSRGQEGTSGASHPSGSAVHLSPTAKMFSDIQTKTKGLSDDGTSLDIDSIDTDSVIVADPSTDAQTVINNAPQDALLLFDKENQRVRSSELSITTNGLRVAGLNLKRADGADISVVSVNADGVTIEDYAIDGNRANNSTAEGTRNEIHITGGSNVTVRDGKTLDSTRMGIQCSPVDRDISDVTIADNRHENPYRDGVSLEYANSNTVSDVDVRGETIIGSATRGGVEVDGGVSQVTIQGVYTENSTYSVSITDHGSAGNTNIEVIGCDSLNCLRGIDCSSITDSLTHRDYTIRGGTHEGCGEYGVYINNIDEGLSVTDVTIHDVTGTNGTDGMRIRGCPGATVNDNNIHGTVDGHGILIWDSPDATANSNIVDGSVAGNGIRFRESNGAAIEDCGASGNRCKGCSYGLGLRSANSTLDYYLLTENRIRGNTNTGVQNSSIGANGVIRDNLS